MRHLISRVANRLRVLIARLHLSKDRQCCICRNYLGRFLPYRGGDRFVSPFIACAGLVGSDVENFSCPRCGAHDRERHLLLYLSATGLLQKMTAARILYFAPERRLSSLIEGMRPERIVRADLFPSDDSITKVDMLDMEFADHEFDFVIANHVLEHVQDDRRALAEIQRVLRPGGFAILQTPYSSVLQATFEDAGLVSPEARLHAYGQEDHVRLYGRDIFDRFAAAGFTPHVTHHADVLKHIDPRRAGVNPLEPFFLFERAVEAHAS